MGEDDIVSETKHTTRANSGANSTTKLDATKMSPILRIISNVAVTSSNSDQSNLESKSIEVLDYQENWDSHGITISQNLEDTITTNKQDTTDTDMVEESSSIIATQSFIGQKPDTDVRDKLKLESDSSTNENNNNAMPSDIEIEFSDDVRNKGQQINFTPSDVADEMEENDASGEFTGYVDFVDEVKEIPEHGKLFRLVVNNNGNRRLMITSWNTNIPAIMDVAEIGNVLEIQGLMVKDKKDRRNNLGSGTLYFETQSITTYKILGNSEKLPADCGFCKIDFQSLNNAQGIICIEGIVKTAPRLQTSKMIEDRIVGGITDGNKVLEIILPSDQRVDHIMKREPFSMNLIHLLHTKNVKS
ncbi:hypothetical protein QAD02_016567 [Eretmocerus hayati]|uniref:Uncharacterized protein n=1 Tax=Eretmocerus hayati TaxID=131215 RepID=A0ACC2PBJ1_9HYME|nr:hypothetical protein QAD02_016567 [Eretmocerus hayati]